MGGINTTRNAYEKIDIDMKNAGKRLGKAADMIKDAVTMKLIGSPALNMSTRDKNRLLLAIKILRMVQKNCAAAPLIPKRNPHKKLEPGGHANYPPLGARDLDT